MIYVVYYTYNIYSINLKSERKLVYNWDRMKYLIIFEMIFVFTTIPPVECLWGFSFLFWILVGRLISLRDRKLVSICNLFDWLWWLLRWFGVVRYHTDLVLEAVDRSLLIQNQELVFTKVCFGIFMVFSSVNLE